MLCCVPPIVCLCACPVLVDVGLLWPQFHLSSVMPRDCLVALTPSFFGSPLALWILEYLFVYQLFLLCGVKSESHTSVRVLLNIAKGTTDPSEFSFTKVICLGHFTKHISNTNLDQISSSEYRPSTNFEISTKHQHFEKTKTS